MFNFENFISVLIYLVSFCFGWFLEDILKCIQKKQGFKTKKVTYFDNFSFQKNSIYEQVLLFAGTLLPNEKIIVSTKDFYKIFSCKDKNGYPIVNYEGQKEFYILHIRLENETINNFARVELGETRTNRNFELKE
jgi:hypothetical protein